MSDPKPSQAICSLTAFLVTLPAFFYRNHDGLISLREFIAGVRAVMPELPESEVSAV